MSRGKTDRSYLSYPQSQSEREAALAAHMFAIKNDLQRPQFVAENGTIHRWDPKGKTKDGRTRYGLIQTDLKLQRNARDRARRLDGSLTVSDFEAAFPGKGRALYAAEKHKLEQIYKETEDYEDVDHIWSLASGGLHASANLRALLAEQNRAEGDRGEPSPLMQTAYMLARDKLDQVRLQGPAVAPRVKLVESRGAIGLAFADKVEQAEALFTFAADQNNVDMVTEIAKSVPGPAKPITNTGDDLAKRAHDAIGNEIEYIKINGNGNGIYGSTPSTKGPRYKNASGGS